MRLITTAHLRSFAGEVRARTRFPGLLKELIQAVVSPQNLRIVMPSDDATWVPGEDGLVICNEQNPFVPIRLSLWECGTGSNVAGKANDDFRKRRQGRLASLERAGKERSEVTYVCATPREWIAKDAWIMQRKAEGIWRDVVVIDGVVLQEWFEAAPAVCLAFATECGRVVPGLTTPQDAWDEWTALTDPPLAEAVVCAGRQEQASELVARLRQPPEVIQVRAHSPREAWGFVLAAIRMLEPQHAAALMNRVVVADSENEARGLRNYRNQVILLRKTNDSLSAFLANRGCHLLVPEGDSGRPSQRVIELTRPTHAQFVDALTSTGAADAERAARECGLSVTVLQRLRAHSHFQPPVWAKACSRPLLPAMLAGRWNRRSAPDRDVMARLAGCAYGEFEGQLLEFLHVDEAPVLLLDDMICLAAPVDVFQLMGQYLTERHFEVFKTVFTEVFSRIDPRVDLPPEQWLYQDIGSENGPSAWLRTGMAETLLLIAERGSAASLLVPAGYVEDVVYGLRDLQVDHRLLASLRDEFPRLSEAAPVPFLRAFEHLLESAPSSVARIFVDTGDGFGANLHAGILWGMESLAWSSVFMHQVSLILAGLAQVDPGGQIHNRPINSLAAIFCWWLPGTNASIADRLIALDAILGRHANVGWRLLLLLLPTSRGLSTGTAKPRWRDFGDLHEDSTTGRGRSEYISAIVERAIDHVGASPARWQKLLDALRGFAVAHRAEALSRLEKVASSLEAEEERLAMWEVLRRFVSEELQHKEPARSLAPEELSRVEAMLTHLSPEDYVARHQWLFDDWYPHGLQAVSEAGEDTGTDTNRDDAVRDVLQHHGVAGIVRLCLQCRYPGLVAQSMMRVTDDECSVREVVLSAAASSGDGPVVAAIVCSSAFTKFGTPWLTWLLAQIKSGDWPAAVAGTVLSRLPDTPASWDLVESLGEETRSEYWRTKQLLNIGGAEVDVRRQVESFVAVGRAMEVFHRVAYRTGTIPSSLLLLLIDAAIKESAEHAAQENGQRVAVSSHDMGQFLRALRAREDIDRSDIARREYQALPILGWQGTSGLVVHRLMAEDPAFFVELLSHAFLAEGEERRPEGAEDGTEQRAMAANRLLETMACVPGLTSEGTLGATALMAWIEEVRRLARQAGRLRVADARIGQVLAHAPVDPAEDAWPHQAVRVVVEAVGSESLEHGLVIGRLNLRGTVHKDVYEGGEQERELSTQYRTWAAASSAWPRLARVLFHIADIYEKEARAEDTRAEQDKLDI